MRRQPPGVGKQAVQQLTLGLLQQVVLVPVVQVEGARLIPAREVRLCTLTFSIPDSSMRAIDTRLIICSGTAGFPPL